MITVKIIDKALKWAGSCLFIGMILTILLQIFARWVLKVSIPWTEELGRLIFIWLVFFGASITTRKSAHIIVDYFSSKVPGNFKTIYSAAILIMCILTTSVFFVGSIKLIPYTNSTFYATMPSVRNSWPYIGGSIGFGFILLYQILELFGLFIKKENGRAEVTQ